MEEEPKGDTNREESQSNGNGRRRNLPDFLFPTYVIKFLRDDRGEPWKTDHDYFEGVLACEVLRVWEYEMRRDMSDRVYRPAGLNDIFANYGGETFCRGSRLRDDLRSMVRELDDKLARKLARMDRRPLMEACLDSLNATELERKIFRQVFVQATGLPSANSGDPFHIDVFSSPPSLVGPSRRMSSISVFCVHGMFADGGDGNGDHRGGPSLADLMELVDKKDSRWVKENLYASCRNPRDQMSGMDNNTLRAFMGFPLSQSQFHELNSSLLQELLLKDPIFIESTAGKAIQKQRNMELETKPKEDEGPSSSLTEALRDPPSRDGGDRPAKRPKKDHLFDVLHQAMTQHAQKEEQQFENGAEESDAGKLDKTDGEDGKPEPNEDKKADNEKPPEASEDDFWRPYKSDLDYLEDQVKFMEKEACLVRYKKSLARDSEDEPENHQPYNARDIPREVAEMLRRSGRGNKDSIRRKMEQYVEKLERDIRKRATKIDTKLAATRRERKQEMRLEQLCEALRLEKFEKYCILSLVQGVIMSQMGNRFSVGELIQKFCGTLEEKMKCRRFFYKSSTLIKEGILTLHQTDFMTDLSNCGVELDRRLFDYIVGLDTEMAEIVDGSHLYLPDVNLDDVILPQETKNRVTDCVVNFDKVKMLFHDLEVDKKITYGLGQVMLFYGASGVGKTMLANAIAAKLKKKILLVNFPTFGENSSGAIIKFLFREARINRALLFFDECESLFMSRTKGRSSINMLLTELERFEGLCILATNRPFDLDEAMHRRISLAIEFRKPDPILRETIWKTLQPPKLPVEADINFGLLAQKFELTGGLIKNAWLQSVNLMIRRDGTKISQEDLMQAASEQVVGQLSMEDFDRRVIPTCGIESVIVSKPVKDSLDTIVQYAKAQAVLFGQWGFEKIHRATTGISALFTGVPGTGKTMAAEAIGYDLGRPLLVVNVAELVSKWVGETGKNIEAVFNDAKKKDAILVFDEAEGLFGSRSDGSMSSSAGRHDTMNVGLLLQYLENFPGVCLVITNKKDAVDEAFFRRFRFVVDFEMPDSSLRERIWKSMVPEECPVAGDVSFRDLAVRYEMCGGDIKSALLRAATKAALRSDAKKRVLNMEDLVKACTEEVQKRGDLPSQGMYT